MTATTCTVSGELRDRAGNLLANTALIVRFCGPVVGDGVVMVPQIETFTSNGSGVISMALYPGNYEGSVNTGTRLERFPMTVPSQATASLADIIAQNVAPQPSWLQQALLAATQAQNARDDMGVTPQQFGAVGDGATDDSAAWQALADFVKAQAFWPEVRLPSGKYLLNSAITFDPAFHNNRDEKGLVIVGNINAVVAVNNSTGFLDWTEANRDARIVLKDFTIQAVGTGSRGTAVAATIPPGGISLQYMADIEGLNIQTNDSAAAWFDVGLDLTGLHRPVLNKGTITGRTQPFQTAFNTFSPGSVGIILDDCYGPRVGGNAADPYEIRGFETGIRHHITTNPGGEGGTFENIAVIYPMIGFDIDGGAGSEPGMEIKTCHANFLQTGFKIRRKRFGAIERCTPYCERGVNWSDADLPDPSSKSVDIDIDTSSDILISRNHFEFGDDPDRINILIGAGCSRITLDGNRHSSGGTAIQIEDGATDITILDPYFESAVDARIVAPTTMTRANLKVRYPVMPFVHASKGAAQSIPNDTWTTITWPTAGSSEIMTIAASGIVTIPSNIGCRRVRATVQGGWSSNDTGFRGLRIIKGLGVGDGAAVAIKPASGLSLENLVAEFDVTDGDTIRVQAWQTSGVAQNFWASGTAPWFKVEMI